MIMSSKMIAVVIYDRKSGLRKYARFQRENLTWARCAFRRKANQTNKQTLLQYILNFVIYCAYYFWGKLQCAAVLIKSINFAHCSLFISPRTPASLKTQGWSLSNAFLTQCRSIESFRLEKTAKTIESIHQHITARSTTKSCPRARHLHIFEKTSRDGDSTTFLGSLFRCSTTLLVKKFFLISDLNLPWHNLRPFLLIPWLVTWEKRLTPTSVQPPFR